MFFDVLQQFRLSIFSFSNVGNAYKRYQTDSRLRGDYDIGSFRKTYLIKHG